MAGGPANPRNLNRVIPAEGSGGREALPTLRANGGVDERNAEAAQD